MSAHQLQLSDAILLHEVGEVEASCGRLGRSPRGASRHAEPMPLIPGNQNEVQIASFDWFKLDSINEYAASRHCDPFNRPSKGKGETIICSNWTQYGLVSGGIINPLESLVSRETAAEPLFSCAGAAA